MRNRAPIVEFLGKPASALIGSMPFRGWKFTRSVDEDDPARSISYQCDGSFFSMRCDGDDLVRSIFLENGFDERLIGLSFLSNREDIRQNLGAPSKSGPAYTHPILGKYGPWDRYDCPEYSIHIHFESGRDRVKMITLMRADVVP